jgi:transcriptional regulator with PAS, ATPase and Fis domain
MAARVAETDANVLITGENGTGKEILAREVHRISSRHDQVMMMVDLGAIAETLFESEMFGHEKGSFTDARESRTGKLEMADRGTLFLDEIGNLSLSMQSKLLNVIQNRQVIKVGSNIPKSIDIRLICATNSDLAQMVEEGLFRQDLLYRINTVVIEMPPLREREGDIDELAIYFLELTSAKYNKGDMKISTQALQKLNKYSWPGNVRELQHAIERAVILSNHSVLNNEDFILKTETGSMGSKRMTTLSEMEETMIKHSLEENQGNLTRAASQLGITRQTLYNKIRKYE